MPKNISEWIFDSSEETVAARVCCLGLPRHIALPSGLRPSGNQPRPERAGRSIGRPVVGVGSQSSLTALIQWLQASGSIGRGARCGNGDCAPFAF
jgi:hypothetical protein